MCHSTPSCLLISMETALPLTLFLSARLFFSAFLSQLSPTLIGSASHSLTWPQLVEIEQAAPLLILQNDRIACTILWHDCMRTHTHTHTHTVYFVWFTCTHSLGKNVTEGRVSWFSVKQFNTPCRLQLPKSSAKEQSSELQGCTFMSGCVCVFNNEREHMQACKRRRIQVCLFPLIVALACN